MKNMPTFQSDPADSGIHLSWQELDRLHRLAADHVTHVLGPAKFDIIVGIGRGGLIPSAHIAYLCDIPRVISVQATKDYSRGEVLVSHVRLDSYDVEHACQVVRGKRVLVVDGALGSGETISAVHQALTYAEPAKLVPIALVGWAGCQRYKNALIDELNQIFVVRATEPWPIFPWEH